MLFMMCLNKGKLEILIHYQNSQVFNDTLEDYPVITILWYFDYPLILLNIIKWMEENYVFLLFFIGTCSFMWNNNNFVITMNLKDIFIYLLGLIKIL